MGIKNEIQQKKFASNLEEALVNVTFTASWKRDSLIEVFKPFNLLPQHFNVLRIIKGCAPKPISPSGIKNVIVDKNRDLTRLVSKLVKMGLVCRTNRAENRRIVDIGITEKGSSELLKMNIALHQFFEKLNGISEEEAKTLSRLLDKLRVINNII